MDSYVPVELEELILCSCCHLQFNDIDLIPKLFSCRHYFCLKCASTVLNKGSELHCIHCWKRTELPAPDLKPEKLPTHTSILYIIKSFLTKDAKPSKSIKSNDIQCNNLVSVKGENCLTHAMPNSLWCTECKTVVCRGCASNDEHQNHTIKTHMEIKESITSELTNELLHIQNSLKELQHLVFQQRNFLLKLLETCTALKTQIETELMHHIPTQEVAAMRENLAKIKVSLSTLEHDSPAEAFKLQCNIQAEKQRMQVKYTEMQFKSKLNDIIRNFNGVFDYGLVKRAVARISSELGSSIYVNENGNYQSSMFLLINYCISQIYLNQIHLVRDVHSFSDDDNLSNQVSLSLSSIYGNGSTNETSCNVTNSSSELVIPKQLAEFKQFKHPLNISSFGQLIEPATTQKSSDARNTPVISLFVPESALTMQIPTLHQSKIGIAPMCNTNGSIIATNLNQSILCNPNVHIYPLYFFTIEINGQPSGRILIEVRKDIAPRMAQNFDILTTGELGFGYKGCTIFQCWENESIITGDFEHNNGRGGRSIFEEGFFMPDDTKILAIRGSVGMRRSQKRHDNMGLVGSQFRIILREMRGFTGIFAFVVEGIELVEKISQTGDSSGKPKSSVIIVNCGKLQ